MFMYILHIVSISSILSTPVNYTRDADGGEKEEFGVVGMDDGVGHHREACACDDMRSLCQNRTI